MSVIAFPQKHASKLALRHDRRANGHAELGAPDLRLDDWMVRSLVVEAIVRDQELASEVIERIRAQDQSAPPRDADLLPEPLTESEARVLRYLPTNLSKREIAAELYVSVNTVKTHVKHLYAKLEVKTRREAVDRARGLGLVARSLSSR